MLHLQNYQLYWLPAQTLLPSPFSFVHLANTFGKYLEFQMLHGMLHLQNYQLYWLPAQTLLPSPFSLLQPSSSEPQFSSSRISILIATASSASTLPSNCRCCTPLIPPLNVSTL